MYLFLFCLLLVFDHLLQLVIGCSVLCFQLLALNSEIATKLLHLVKVAKNNNWLKNDTITVVEKSLVQNACLLDPQSP